MLLPENKDPGNEEIELNRLNCSQQQYPDQIIGLNGLYGTVNTDFDPFYQSDQYDRFNIGKYFNLSYRQRLWGCRIFSLIGYLMLASSSILYFLTKPMEFAITYFFANVVLMGATLFLFGPIKQINIMLNHGKTRCAFLTYFIAMILLLIFVFVVKVPEVYCVVLLFQWVAWFDYIVILFPGGDTACIGCDRDPGIVIIDF
jgi:hypothetical protein